MLTIFIVIVVCLPGCLTVHGHSQNPQLLQATVDSFTVSLYVIPSLTTNSYLHYCLLHYSTSKGKGKGMVFRPSRNMLGTWNECRQARTQFDGELLHWYGGPSMIFHVPPAQHFEETPFFFICHVWRQVFIMHTLRLGR